MENYMFLLPEVREMTSSGRRRLGFHSLLRNASFLSDCLPSSVVVRVELIPEYLDCLLEFGELEFALDLAQTKYILQFCLEICFKMND